MGDGITSENELVITISDEEAGTTKGQLILEDVEYRMERDNEQKHGIGNDTPKGISYGNKECYVSHTAILNESAADLAMTLADDDTVEGMLRTPNMEIDVGKLDWNDWNVSASDDGDVTFEVEFDAREFEVVEKGD